ncbi:hypothetical protein P0D75_06910 [Paraburkholderia sediminicola]|uniref:hypothetical protein n=1 Tax=Paraburkholderia sediminicola TaxID=458836 RepID=UPI0038BCCAE8
MKTPFDYQLYVSLRDSGRAQYGTDSNAVLSTLRDFTYESSNLGCFVVPTNSLPTSAFVGCDETHCMALVFGPSVHINWENQMADWLIPFNELDYVEQRAETLLLIGDGPTAVDWSKISTALPNSQQALAVLYVFPEAWLMVKYRWNSKLIDVLDELAKTTQQFHDMESHEMPYGQSAAFASRGLTDVDALKPGLYGYLTDGGNLHAFLRE